MAKKPCSNKNCTWKYDYQSHSHCPVCGQRTPKSDQQGVQTWNSTLKQYPSNRLQSNKQLSPRSNKRSKRNSDGDTALQSAMKEKAQQWTFHSLQKYNKIVCENCGIKIRQVKWANISHLLPRSTHPDKMNDLDKMEVVCAAPDFMGEEDQSCHTLWEQNRYEEYFERTNTYLVMKVAEDISEQKELVNQQ